MVRQNGYSICPVQFFTGRRKDAKDRVECRMHMEYPIMSEGILKVDVNAGAKKL
jgi:hypothetical protein